MNGTNVYEDCFQASFTKQEKFIEFLNRIGKNSFWNRRKSKELRFVAITEGSEVAMELKESYKSKGLDENILTDTIQNTGLLLKTKNDYYPVRSCAVKTILDRACIKGSALRKVNKNVYARILNDCLKVASGEALLRVSEGKLSAVLGGNCSDYAVLDMEQIFLRSIEYLDAHFKHCNYLGGFYEHHMASSLWELSGEDELLEAYKEELRLHGKTMEEMKPVIRIMTSDTGESGANIYPMLLSGSRNDIIMLGSPLKLEHKAGATLSRFDEQLSLLYGKYQLAVGNLSKLLHIDVIYPVNCMIGVMKKLGIPKKYAMEAAELFKAQYGEDVCTAHEIYYGISEILFILGCEGAEGSKMTDMEEKIARALSIQWKAYDMPGEITW